MVVRSLCNSDSQYQHMTCLRVMPLHIHWTDFVSSLMTWFGLYRTATPVILSDPSILSFFGTYAVPTPVKTISKLFGPAFAKVLPKTGDAEPEDPGKPG